MSVEAAEDDVTSPKIMFVSSDDKVVSEVNPFLVGVAKNSVQPLQKSSNLVATITFSLPEERVTKSQKQSSGQKLDPCGPALDEDGDMILTRSSGGPRQDEELQIFIEYENATTLDLVGLQIWRGAFLLSDYCVHNASHFEGKNLLELGSGTGLVGILGSLFSKHVVLTDLNEPSIMDLLKANISHNKRLIGNNLPGILPLDFMADVWSQELTDAISSSDIIIAADVIYHVEITNAFIRTLKKILETGDRPKNIFIALEKRYVFTLSDMDSVSPMHNHFLEELDTQLGLSPGCLPRPLVMEGAKGPSNMEISMIAVPLDFKQYFNYDRCKELVLYHIASKKISHS